MDVLQLGVVVQEESEPLVGDVGGTVAAQLPMLLHRHAPAREGVLVDLLLDLLGRVGDEDGGGDSDT